MANLNAEAWGECIDRVRKAAKVGWSDDEIASFLNRAKSRVERETGAKGFIDDANFLEEYSEEVLNEATIKAFNLKRQRALALTAKQSRDVQILSARKAGASEFEATASLNVGSQKGFAGAGNSVENIQKAKAGEYLQVFEDLRKYGFLDVVASAPPEFQRDFAIHMSIFSGAKREKPNNPRAEQLAKIFYKYSEKVRKDLNSIGPSVGQLEGFVATQSHDRWKIQRVTEKEWREFTFPKIDIEKTFGGLDPNMTAVERAAAIDEWMGNFYRNIETGLHDDVSQTAADYIKDLEEFKGPSNLSKKLSQSRKMIFKDAESYLDYNNQFGTGSVFESLFNYYERSARAYGLMKIWGPNPEAAFKSHMAQVTQELKDSTTTGRDIQKKFKSFEYKLQNQFDQVTGKANIAANPTISAIASAYRTLLMTARLGGVAFSSITDVPVKTSVMRHNGIHVAQGYVDGIVSYAKGLGGDERKSFISQFNVANEGMQSYFKSRFSEAGTLRGFMSKAHYYFGKLSLLNYVTNAQRAGMLMSLTNNIAHVAGKEFDQLDKLLATNLRRYNIDKLEWDVLRKAKVAVVENREFIGTDGVRLLDADEFTDLARRNNPDFDKFDLKKQNKLLEREREQLELNYRKYVVDQVDESITKVGAREKAAMYGNSKAGTAWGEAVRMFWQFKSFGLTYVNKHLRREFSRGGADVPGVVQLLAGTTIFGVVANALSDVNAGRIPRDLNDPKTWLAAFIRGGGVGIYGDFLFGEYTKYKSSPIAALSGPAIGELEDAARVFGYLRDFEFGKAGAEFYRLFQSHIPGQNLFYTKQATDYLINYQILEMINPGYLKRREDRYRKDLKQDYFLPPSSIVKRGGGFR